MTFRIGLIGAGAMGATHARTLVSQVPGVRLTHVFDQDRDRAAVVANIAGAAVAPTAADLIDAVDVDAVVIASPDATHPALALACIDAGKPALCEKPLATSSAAAIRVVQREVDAGQRYIQVGFMRRYDPGFVELKRVVSRGLIGSPVIVHCVHRNASSSTSTTDAGIVTGSLIHELDTVSWLLESQIRSVRVESPRVNGLRDPQLASFYLESGAIATAEVFVNAQYGYEVQCEVVGSAGVAALPGRPQVDTRTPGQHAQRVGVSFVDHFADAYRLQLTSWAAERGALLDDSPSAWDGFHATLVAETAVEALKSGRPVDVPMALRPTLYTSARDTAQV